MSQQNLFHPTARQAYKNYFYLKVVLFWAFVFWLYGSLKVQPALQADKWATVSVAAALGFGIVFLTYAAAKSWRDPNNVDGPGGLGWFYTILAALVCASDVFFVHERMEALSVNGLISTSATTSPLFNYAVSAVLLIVNLALSLGMAAAYYRANLHEEAIQLDLMDAQYAHEHRQEWLNLMREKVRIFFTNRRRAWSDGAAQSMHVSQIKEDRRKGEAARSAAMSAMETQKAEKMRLDAEAMEIENQKRRNAHARAKAALGPIIEGEFKDVSDGYSLYQRQSGGLIMFRLIIAILFGLYLAITSANAAVQIVIMDNGGTLQQTDKGTFLAKKALLQKLSVEASGFFGDDDIAIVLTNSGTVEFRKPASQFPASVSTILPFMKAQPVCSNLVEAFNAAENLLRQMPKDEVKGSQIHLFSSLIHTPSDCDDFLANVPQAVPTGLDLSYIAKHHVPLTIYWAQNSQKKIWDRYLNEKGVNARILGVIETVSHLGVEVD